MFGKGLEHLELVGIIKFMFKTLIYYKKYLPYMIRRKKMQQAEEESLKFSNKIEEELNKRKQIFNNQYYLHHFFRICITICKKVLQCLDSENLHSDAKYNT